MNFDPRKCFIDLMDFFSILLPCGLLAHLLMREVGPDVLRNRFPDLVGVQAWAAFLFASYLFGHLGFLLGSSLDEFYDWARRYTLNTQIALLARHLLPWLARALIWLPFKGERSRAVDRPGKIKQQALGVVRAKDAVNTFQWGKARMNAENPASLVIVQRCEAAFEFFRCAGRRGNRVRRRCRWLLPERVVVVMVYAWVLKRVPKNNRRFEPWPT